MKPQITGYELRVEDLVAGLQRSCGMKPQITAGRARELFVPFAASKELRHEAADHALE